MKIIDFHRSFIFWEVDFVAKPPKTVSDPRQNRHNRARVRIDCRCTITRPSGKSTDYYLGESCKTERVGCPKELLIFIQPNADFRPAYSKEEMVFFKSWDKNDKGVMLVPASLGPQPERQVANPDDSFFRHRLALKHTAGVELKTTAKIIAATNAAKPLVARTEFKKAGFNVVLEYPLVCFNVSEPHQYYQSDTGPVIFPELTKDTKSLGSTFRLAFSAFNNPDWIEFIVQKPTPVGKGISVSHYSENVQVDCKNSIFVTK